MHMVEGVHRSRGPCAIDATASLLCLTMSRGAKCVGMSMSMVTALVMLVGCTGGTPHPPQTFATYVPTGVPTPSPSVSAAPVATLAPVPLPTTPAEMGQGDAAGAVAAARYFLDLQVYTMATGDTAEWDRVAWDRCQACTAIRAETTRVHSGGGSLAPSVLGLSRSEAGPRSPTRGGFPVEVDFAIAWGAEFDAAGTEVATPLNESGTLIVDVLFEPGGWVLMEISGGTAS